MTGMPAWSDHSEDQELWAIVAFVQKPPSMNELCTGRSPILEDETGADLGFSVQLKPVAAVS